jgi:hypothetical protein
MKWAGHVAHMGNKRNTYRVLERNSKGKRPQRRPRSRWEDNIKIELKEIGWGVMDWIHLDHVRNQWRTLVKTAMKLRVKKKCSEFLDQLGDGQFLTRNSTPWS